MRRLLLFGLMFLGAREARAQSSVVPFLGSGNAKQTVNTPLNQSQAIAVPQMMQGRKPFSLTNMFSKLTLPAGHVVATSPLPPPSAFPSSYYKSPLRPQMPVTQILPKTKK